MSLAPRWGEIVSVASGGWGFEICHEKKAQSSIITFTSNSVFFAIPSLTSLPLPQFPKCFYFS